MPAMSGKQWDSAQWDQFDWDNSPEEIEKAKRRLSEKSAPKARDQIGKGSDK